MLDLIDELKKACVWFQGGSCLLDFQKESIKVIDCYLDIHYWKNNASPELIAYINEYLNLLAEIFSNFEGDLLTSKSALENEFLTNPGIFELKSLDLKALEQVEHYRIMPIWQRQGEIERIKTFAMLVKSDFPETINFHIQEFIRRKIRVIEGEIRDLENKKKIHEQKVCAIVEEIKNYWGPKLDRRDFENPLRLWEDSRSRRWNVAWHGLDEE